MINSNKLVVIAIFSISLCTETSADPDKLLGPTASFSSMSPTSTNETERPLGIEQTSKYLAELSLLYPLSSDFLKMTVVPTLGYSNEKRTMETGASSALEVDSSWSNIVPGIILAPNQRPLGITPFVLARRYSDVQLKRKPLNELILGGDYTFKEGQMLKKYRIRKMRLRGIYRLRQFPDTQTFLGVAYLDTTFQNGLYLSLGLPSHFRLGIHREARGDDLFFEIAAKSRNFPIEINQEQYWTDGFSLSTGIGYRFPVSDLLYGLIRSGVITEELNFISEEGEREFLTSTKSSFWFAAAIETWVSP